MSTQWTVSIMDDDQESIDITRDFSLEGIGNDMDWEEAIIEMWASGLLKEYEDSLVKIDNDIDYWKSYNDNLIIIDEGRNTILHRIKNDPTVKVSEINGVISEAFKQNQLIRGGATDNVQLNMKVLQDSSPDELFNLLQQLND